MEKQLKCAREPIRNASTHQLYITWVEVIEKTRCSFCVPRIESRSRDGYSLWCDFFTPTTYHPPPTTHRSHPPPLLSSHPSLRPATKHRRHASTTVIKQSLITGNYNPAAPHLGSLPPPHLSAILSVTF
ncbi:hypothetical protein E2C01_055402 [Portunus trituberculatus]|uniref:Uncharacterized protein n=1 Tax=Portunus trituberculatus TaxID=210409 RepID=A0A5B7GR30_PORTR|nr:hypothetical protein [Portunus trituberculatus]